MGNKVKKSPQRLLMATMVALAAERTAKVALRVDKLLEILAIYYSKFRFLTTSIL